LPDTIEPFPFAAPALTREGFRFETSQDKSVPLCEYRLTSSLNVVNGDQSQTVTTVVQRPDDLEFEILDSRVGPAPGTGLLPVCKGLNVSKREDGFMTSFTCEKYRDMIEAGYCAVSVTIANP